MSEAAKCPKCGAESKQWQNATGQMFCCDSWLPTDGELDQSNECRIAELEAALAEAERRIRELTRRAQP